MISEPIPLPEAFAHQTPQAYRCQAAFLLLLGLLTHREPLVDATFAIEHTPLQWDELGIEEDCRELGIPDQVIALQQHPVRRLRFSTFQQKLRKDNIEVPEWFERSFDSWRGIEALSAELASKLFEAPTVLNAAKLIAVAVHHQEPLVRIAAASACFEVVSDAQSLAGPALLV